MDTQDERLGQVLVFSLRWSLHGVRSLGTVRVQDRRDLRFDRTEQKWFHSQKETLTVDG